MTNNLWIDQWLTNANGNLLNSLGQRTELSSGWIHILIFFGWVLVSFALIFLHLRSNKAMKRIQNEKRANGSWFQLLTLLFYLAYILMLFLLIQLIPMNEILKRSVFYMGVIIFGFGIIRFLDKASRFGLEKIILANSSGLALNPKTLKGLAPALTIFIWTIGLIFLLSNLGFNISAIVAGLGIGGIAIALALQTVLKDVFCYFSIVLDKPFETGDFIIAGKEMGTVESIGLRSTHIRSLLGEQVIVPNSDLTGSRIENHKRMEERRLQLNLTVEYRTELSLLREIPGKFAEIVNTIPDVRFDRAHLSELGDNGPVYEIVYFVLSGDYKKSMDIRQEIHFRILEYFQAKRIRLAYQTLTLDTGDTKPE